MRRGFVLVGVLPLVSFGRQAARSEPADWRTQIRGEKGEGLALGGRVLDPDGAPRTPHREPLLSALGGARVELEPAPHGTVLRPGVGAHRVRVALDDGRTLERVAALAEGATTLVTLAP